MRNLLSVGFAGLALLFVACGNTSDRPNTLGGGGSGTGGKSGSTPVSGKSGTDEGGAGGDGSMAADPLAPVVTITSPEAVDDPNEDGVLSGTEVEVVCTAKKSPEAGAEEVDGTSIKLQLLDAEGELLLERDGSPTTVDDEYSANFILTDQSAGILRFRCTATDRGGLKGEDEISSLFDKGPIITFETPLPDSYQALQQNLGIRFTVDAAPLPGGDDEGAEVDTVTMTVAGKSIDLGDAERAPGEYQVDLDLTDPLFTPSPNGPIGITVEATNRRKPAAVVASKTQITSIDGASPTIVISSPKENEVVGDLVSLEFEVSDDVSGADPASVVVTLNQEQEPYDEADEMRWKEDNGKFKFEFDSREVQGSKIQVTINIVATDRVGNQSAVATRFIYLDNESPSLDLDPLNVRILTPRSPQEDLCSASFDPVGPGALNDRENAGRDGPYYIGGTVRALVWDQTNYVSADFEQHFSGVRQNSVRVYVSHEAILKDSDGDGVCDDVVDEESMAAVAFEPLPNMGTLQYEGEDDALPPAIGQQCVTEGTQAEAHLCGGNSDMEYVMVHDEILENQADDPAIYVPPGAMGDICTGGAWEFNTLIDGDGWVCLVARAEDHVGNVGISRPLRLCVDAPVGGAEPGDDRTGSPACVTDKSNPPSCAVNCTPPARWGNYIFVQ